MSRINSLEELMSLKEDYKKLIQNRLTNKKNSSNNISNKASYGLKSQNNSPATSHIDILVCGGTGCQASESIDVLQILKEELTKANLQDKVKVEATGCFGFCEKGPIVKIMPENIFYIEVTPERAKLIIEEHIIKGNLVEQCIYSEPITDNKLPKQDDLPFYKKQIRIALKNCGLINPEDIRQYIALDGYQALGKALFEMYPEKVIDEIKRSGLRGRGGGGFPTGVKWEMSRKSKSEIKYFICNADEGDPGAFMDRSILEGDPHSVLEAMAIGGYCIGASMGYALPGLARPIAARSMERG